MKTIILKSILNYSGHLKFYSCINYTTKDKCKGRIHTYLDERIIKETPHCHKPFEIKSEQKRSVVRSLASIE